MTLTIKVPATSANLGPGFDVAGLALTLYNEFEFDFGVDTVSFYDSDYSFDTSLTLDTFFDVLDMYSIERPKGVKLTTTSRIPVARGLGSSSTCIVAGLLAANEYGNLNLSKEELARVATKIEGHPDNVVPALFGNINLSLMDDHLFIQKGIVHDAIEFIAIIPSHPVSTKEARAVLPTTYTLDTLIYTSSRSAFLLEAFKTNDKVLFHAILKDKVHEPYRKQLIQNINSIEVLLKHDLITGYWVSGAGPTILAITDKNNTKEVVENLTENIHNFGTLKVLQIDTKGAMIS